MRFEAGQIAVACAEAGGRLVNGRPETVFTGLSTDSRAIRPGQVFVALSGDNFDGHRFAAQALADGAAGLVVRTGWLAEQSVPVDAAVIEVEDTLAGLGLIARQWRLAHQAPVLAISGSMGKSSVKEMAAAILAVSRRVVKNEGNFNNLIGLPLTLLKINEETEAVVVEAGINQVGEMERLADIARPQAGLLTNVGPVHLEGFGDLEGVLKAKTALWRVLDDSGVAVVNLDDPLLSRAAGELTCRKITYGRAEAADVRLTGYEPKNGLGLNLDLRVAGRPLQAFVPALGSFQAQNAAAACAGALALGASAADMAEGLAGFTPLKHRCGCSRTAPGSTSSTTPTTPIPRPWQPG